MISLSEAQAQVLACAAPLEAERVPLSEAEGRPAAEDAGAAVDLPPFDRSAMDGYAVRAVECDTPLLWAGDVPAGAAPPALAPGTTMGISTGAAIPEGADAVLQSEHAIRDEDRVIALEPVAPGKHIRRRGEDVAAGTLLARAGEELNLQRLSALASAGVGEVAVHRRARLDLLVTGSELLALGAPAAPGRVHESNGLTLRLLAERARAFVIDHGVAPDDPSETRERIASGLEGDVLVITGGVSVGEHDHVRPALAELGVQERFWQVAVRPGKPVWFGTRGATLVFGLPGNPLSAVVGFLAFVEPALRRLQGDPDARMRTVPARLTAGAGPSGGRATFLTARLERREDGTLEATPTMRQGSHMTGALAESDGFVLVTQPSPAGALVPALVL